MGGALLPPPPRGLRKVREKISWIEDEDLSRLEEKPELGAASLSFLTGGGGQLFVSDYRRGFALTAAQVGAAALGIAAAAPVAWIPFVALGAASAVDAWRKARYINRFLAARREDYDRNNPHPAAYRLLAAMSAADPTAYQPGMVPQQAAPPAPGPSAPPSPFAELVERLRKVAALHEGGAIDESELRARKVEILEKNVSAVERDQLDDMLYELLPLLEEGVLDGEDVDFIKRLQGV